MIHPITQHRESEYISPAPWAQILAVRYICFQWTLFLLQNASGVPPGLISSQVHLKKVKNYIMPSYVNLKKLTVNLLNNTRSYLRSKCRRNWGTENRIYFFSASALLYLPIFFLSLDTPYVCCFCLCHFPPSVPLPYLIYLFWFYGSQFCQAGFLCLLHFISICMQNAIYMN